MKVYCKIGLSVTFRRRKKGLGKKLFEAQPWVLFCKHLWGSSLSLKIVKASGL